MHNIKKRLQFVLLFLSVCLLPQTGFAQSSDTVTWKNEGSLGFNFSNVGLSNWAAGGQSSFALGTKLNYTKTRISTKDSWKNQLDFALGGTQIGKESFRKNDDNIIILSQYNLKINDKWGYSVTGSIRTQLLEGINYESDVLDKISDFMAPGYLNLNLGFKYTVGDVFTSTMAPFAGKFTFVLDDFLSSLGAFGVTPGDQVRSEFGANILSTLKIPIAENISLESNLNLFTGYETFGNVDVFWNTLLVMKVNSWFNATFGTELIYDDDIKIEQDNGAFERKIQFKHVLNVGVNFSLAKAN
jgi:DUF3078 family protein